MKSSRNGFYIVAAAVGLSFFSLWVCVYKLIPELIFHPRPKCWIAPATKSDAFRCTTQALHKARLKRMFILFFIFFPIRSTTDSSLQKLAGASFIFIDETLFYHQTLLGVRA